MIFYKFEHKEGKEAFWHSTALFLALVLEEIYDWIKLTFGPAISNGFYYDVDFGEEHVRTSLGVEARSAVLEFYANRYVGLADGYNEEHVLDGWDYNLSSQIPFLHWAKAFMNSYEWEGVTRDDVKGTKIGSELLLTPKINFELAYDD